MKTQSLLFVLALAVPAAAQTVTPAAYTNWPGDGAFIFYTGGGTQSARVLIDDLAVASAPFLTLGFRTWDSTVPAVNLDFSIDISWGLPASTSPAATYVHNATRTTILARATHALAAGATVGGGVAPTDPMIMTPPNWTFTLSNPVPAGVTNSVLLDITVYSVTDANFPWSPVQWKIEGFRHYSSALFPFFSNEGRKQYHATHGCGPRGLWGPTYMRELFNTGDIVLSLQGPSYGAAPGQGPATDFVAIGFPNAFLPQVTMTTDQGATFFLCTPQIDNSLGFYVVPVSASGTYWRILGNLPWSPALNYAAMYAQVWRYDALAGYGVQLTDAITITTHYEPGPLGVKMPGDTLGSGTTVEGGPILTWQ